MFSGLVVFKRCVWTENLMFWTLQTLITQVTESYWGSDIQLTRILWCNPWLSVLCNLACWVFFFPHRTVLHIFQLVYWSIISSFKTVDVYTWPVSWGSNCKKKLHLKWNSVSERFYGHETLLTELVCLSMTHYAARCCVLGPWLCFPPTSVTQPSEL